MLPLRRGPFPTLNTERLQLVALEDWHFDVRTAALRPGDHAVHRRWQAARPGWRLAAAGDSSWALGSARLRRVGRRGAGKERPDRPRGAVTPGRLGGPRAELDDHACHERTGSGGRGCTGGI